MVQFLDVECDIRVPQGLTKTFAEMTPIFENVEISRNDIGDHMKHYAERKGGRSSKHREEV